MVDEAHWLNLDDIVREVTETPTQGTADLAVWGGTFDASRLGDFLQTWDLPRPGMLWNVWQWTDQIRLGHGEGSPGDLDYLERGRVFGEAGDLSLRRDGSRFLWHFVGVTGTAPPDGFEFDDYWDDRAGAPLRSRQRTALLWGEECRNESGNPLGIWQEDRVAAAVLEYPGLRGARRVRMRYREYLRGGRVELVWSLGLEPASQSAEEEHDA